jgi:perosamine synthetase
VYSCSALSNAATLAGCRPMFLDVAPDQPIVTPENLSQSGADIVVATHMFGIPIDLRGLSGTLIEDCAQALGARVGDRAVGLQGIVACYSFAATKLMTSGGQGGMIVAMDSAVIAAVRDYRQFDLRRDRRPRFNFQMTDMQAAIGRVQLARLPLFLERRAKIFARYRTHGIELLESGDEVIPVRFRAVLRCEDPAGLISRLAAAGISAIIPVEAWELLDSEGHYSNALDLCRTSVSIPIHPSMTDADVDRVAEGVMRCR